jgi:hypothetical protein
VIALTIPALLRWPLVLCPAYALLVVVVLAALLLEWRWARQEPEKPAQRDAKAFRVIRGGHRS